MVLPWETCESRGLELHNAEEQGVTLPGLAQRAGDSRTPLAALQVLAGEGGFSPGQPWVCSPRFSRGVVVGLGASWVLCRADIWSAHKGLP